MKIILTVLLSVLFKISLFAQSQSLLGMSNGDIYIYGENCCLELYNNYPVFNDIAYGNDKIYAVNTNLNIIDFNSKQLVSSFPIYNVNGTQIYSDGLEIVNDSLLFLDDETDLYCYNLNTNSIEFVGNTGYYCSGDLLFLDNKLYMTTDSNELLEISFNSSYTIANISIVSSFSLGSVYGLSKNTNTSEIILFCGISSYEVNISSMQYSKICDFSTSVNGATYYREKTIEANLPNIITANNDNVNDLIDLSEYLDFSIINRWGEEVFNSAYAKVWKGENKNGDPVVEGVYFIIVHFENCEIKKTFYQNITISR